MEVVLLGVCDILLRSLVVRRRDGVDDVVHHRRELVRLDVHQTGRYLARRRILQVFQVERVDVAFRIHVDHASGLALGKEFVYADTQFRAVRQVVCDRGLAADLVTQLHGAALDLEADLLELFLDHLVEDVRLRYLAQLGMPVLVIGEMDAALADLLVAQCVEYAFRDDGGAVVHAHDLTLDDRRDDEVHDLFDRDFRLVEHLGDDDHRVVAGLADAECQVAGAAAHGSQYEPVAARAGVHVDGACDDGTLVLGRLVTERRRAFGQRQVVVDGLGHVDVCDGVFLGLQELGDAVRGRCRVVAADRHEQFDVVVGEELEVEVVFEIRILGFETAHLQERTSLVEDAVGHGVVDVHHAGRRVEEPRVALVQADYAVTFAEESLCDAAYHGVHTGCGAAASQNCDCFFHDCDWVFMFEPELT